MKDNYIFKYILLLPIFVFIQILVLNEVFLSLYIIPFLYVGLIINLPIKEPKWFSLLYAFIIGLLIDIFSSTIGFHSTACTLIAFIKPFICKITISQKIITETEEITLKKIGSRAFLMLSLILILIHHSCLFFIEHLSFNLNVLLKIIASSLATYVVILIGQLFFNSNNK